MKLDPSLSPLGDTDLQESVIFPANATSVSGAGEMQVDPAKTLLVLPDTLYSYDFELTAVSTDVTTVGIGTVYVRLDVSTPQV